MKPVDRMETQEHKYKFHVTRIIKTFNGALRDTL